MVTVGHGDGSRSATGDRQQGSQPRHAAVSRSVRVISPASCRVATAARTQDSRSARPTVRPRRVRSPSASPAICSCVETAFRTPLTTSAAAAPSQRRGSCKTTPPRLQPPVTPPTGSCHSGRAAGRAAPARRATAQAARVTVRSPGR